MERLDIVASLAGIDPAEWDALVERSAHDTGLAPGNPFVRHAYLDALIETGCATVQTGWRPTIILLKRAGALTGAMPVFEKTHSYGEYVFDWAWADAYARHGVEYYPKLLGAVPFTPVAGPRLIAATRADRETLAAVALAQAQAYSSLHVLFPSQEEAQILQAQGMMLRRTVQFHWTNEGYADFDAFLARLSHRRRKTIRQERRRVREAGVQIEWRRGAAVTREDWAFFHRCYCATYGAHLSHPYLNLAFFQRVGVALAEHVVLVIASREGRPIAASLLFEGGKTLYGRYWGALEHVPLLHFECCYYQAIEYAIAHGLHGFEGGAQGEHKLFRGLLPVETHSAHWLRHPAFAQAVDDFLARERRGIARYVSELEEHTPFKTG